MYKQQNTITAITSIILGLLLVIMKGEVISIALTIAGIAILLSAVSDFTHQMTNLGIIKSVIGVCILIFGWMFINLALYILAAAIIIMGLLKMSNMSKGIPVNLTMKEKGILYIKPLLTVLAGVCLLFHQGGAIDWVFTITGVLLVAEGVMDLAENIRY